MRKKQESHAHTPARLLLKPKWILIVSSQMRTPELREGAGLLTALALQKFGGGAAGVCFSYSSGIPLLSLDSSFRTPDFSTLAATASESERPCPLSHPPLRFQMFLSFLFRPPERQCPWLMKCRLCSQTELGPHPGSGSSMLCDLQQFAYPLWPSIIYLFILNKKGIIIIVGIS